MIIEQLIFNPDGTSYIGTVELADDFYNDQPEAPETDDTNVWDELDAAYQEGVDSI